MQDKPGDRQRYESWVRDYAGELFRFSYRLCGCRDIAEDLVQETFYEAWRGMHTLKDASKSRAWLYQILRHRYAHWVRKDRRQQQTIEANRPPTDLPDTTDRATDRFDEIDALQKALNDLDERFRMPLLLVYMEGMTCQQAADQMNVPIGTVLSRIHRARLALRESLREHDPDADECAQASTTARPRLRFGE